LIQNSLSFLHVDFETEIEEHIHKHSGDSKTDNPK
jgi:hypothetical protein